MNTQQITLPSGRVVRVPASGRVATQPLTGPRGIVTGETCTRCGGMLVRTGTCYTCATCAESDGCG